MPGWGTFRATWCPRRARPRFGRVKAAAIGVFVLALCLTLAGGTSAPVLTSPAFLIAGMTRHPVAARRAVRGRPRRSTRGGLRMVASTDGQQFQLHTAAGERTFLPGVNLGSTTPGHQPGELSISAAQYRAWFAAMGWLGHPGGADLHDPPARVLSAAGRVQPGEPGPAALSDAGRLPAGRVVHPEEEPLRRGGHRRPSRRSCGTPSGAVSGDLTRPATPGRASGTWDTDVTPLAGRLDHRRRARSVRGRRSPTSATPSAAGRLGQVLPQHRRRHPDRTLAGRPDGRTGRLSRRGEELSQPIAFVNWPTTDPLRHPDEPLPSARTCCSSTPTTCGRPRTGRPGRSPATTRTRTIRTSSGTSRPCRTSGTRAAPTRTRVI